MRLLYLLLALCPFSTFCQNLLVNGGFEEENICAEYKINCAPEAWMYSVPSYSYFHKGESQAYRGTYFVAFIAGHALKPYNRTFVRSRLLCRLQSGQTYQLRFFIKSPHPVLDSVGVLFTSHDFLYDKRPLHKVTPSVFLANASKKPVAGHTGWQEVIINYTAFGHEGYITLGFFRKRDLIGSTGVEKEANYLVMLDEISMVPLNPKERICPDWQKRKQEIYEQDERHEYQAKVMTRYRNNPPESKLPSPTITLNIDTLVVPDVLFATNSFVINKNALGLLDSFAKRINTLSIDSILVNGHTDYTGTVEYNRELSYRRAASVAAYLQRTVKTHLVTRGLGSDQPVADNRTPAGRQRNRRVEILIYKK